MKLLKELKLSKKTEAKVRSWLNEWLQHFITLANNEQGNVYRADFKKFDFFYYTSCNDILSQDPYTIKNGSTRGIARRKQCVMLQLFVKSLLGVDLSKKIKCSHCGYDDRYIGGCECGSYIYCKKCGFTTINTFPGIWKDAEKIVHKELIKKGLVTEDE